MAEKSGREGPPSAPACPACGADSLENFYTLRGIPAYSCALMTTREEALDCPRGDLELALCRICGFITNTAYAPIPEAYSARYEETQGYSPTFSRYARGLARRLVDTHQLRGATVVEVGCGKGEFLVALCEEGAGAGIGIDPAYVPGRLAGPALDRITFIRDFYRPAHRELQADFLCCRHTLEHIHEVRAFLELLLPRDGHGTVRPIFFDVPDARRVLLEGAFWDLYHEHCSYFTAGSLGRLARSAGVRVEAIWREYGDQYLLLTGSDDGGENGPFPPFEIEESAERIADYVRSFTDRSQAALTRWSAFLENARREARRVVLWGSGSKGVAFLTTLRVDEEVGCVVDVNPHRHDMYMPGSGHRIVRPEFLQEYRPDTVIVMNPIYVEEIGARLSELGVPAEVVPIV